MMAVPSYLREQVVEQGDRKEELLLALVDTIADQEPKPRFLTIDTIGGDDALIDFDHIACVRFGVRFLETDAIRIYLSGGAELHQRDTEFDREWWTKILTGGSA